MAFSVFGTKPIGAIYLGDLPYVVRFNCAGSGGGLFIGGSEPENRRTSAKESVEISVIKASRYFGDLGQTKSEFWLQLWFVPAPSCAALPKNQVCVSYLKKQSVNNLFSTVAEAMDSGEPTAGIFVANFERQQGALGVYYAIRFDWRERQGEVELLQLEQIEAFMAGDPRLLDHSGTRGMVRIDNLTTEEVELLTESAYQQAQQKLLAGG